jgi:2-keto-4-pentenoate hydratase/2-oxohepta-3-ene-1,7-dioic acid hydratase in catechol pathway
VKILRFDDWKTGLLIEGSGSAQVLDVGANLDVFRVHDPAGATLLQTLLGAKGDGDWGPMIDSWESAGKVLHSMVNMAGSSGGSRMILKPLSSVRLRAPLPSPHARIFALGGNVASHMAAAMTKISGKTVTVESILAERTQGLPPWGFLVLADTVVGPFDPVYPPAGVTKYDYEAEVAVLLRGGGRNIKAKDVTVWGYTAWNDLSIRDGRLGIGPPIHRGAFNWAMEKNFDTGNTCGPWVVVDEPRNPMKLRVQMRVNGVTRQDWSTEEMMYSFADTAEFLSKFATLKAGDIICSGTGHGTAAEYGADGDRWLKPGDKLEVEVESVGILRNDVASW